MQSEHEEPIPEKVIADFEEDVQRLLQGQMGASKTLRSFFELIALSLLVGTILYRYIGVYIGVT